MVLDLSGYSNCKTIMFDYKRISEISRTVVAIEILTGKGSKAKKNETEPMLRGIL